jgi:PST family polysaccharide transporter
MLRFGGDLTFTNIVYFVSASLDQVLIGKLFGPATLGIYRQGYSLVLAPITQLTFPVTVVAESALSRLQDDGERYRRYYRKLLSALSMATMPLLVLMAVHAEDVIRVSLGPAWIEAAPVFRIMAVAAFIRPAATTLGPVMITCGHTRTVVRMGLLSALALAVFVVAGAPWGPTGVAFAHVWTVYVLLVPKLYWSVKGTPVTMRLFFAALWRPFAASMLMAGVVTALRLTRSSDTPLENMFVGTLAGAAVYLVVWLATPAGRAELMELIADLGGSFGLARPLRRPAADVVTQTR